jgi:transcriptional regulator with XRE-family HTH domain
MKKTNFDRYLEQQLQDPDFARRFHGAGEAWDVALQLAALRKEAGLSQKQLARKLKTSQQQISRLESPGYEGHSLSMLRRVATALGATVRVTFGSPRSAGVSVLHEPATPYKTRKRS